MKILNAEQIREWDQFTIKNEPVASIDLMERAATACVEWLEKNNLIEQPVIIYCGKGNNGGDGLAIARMLSEQQSHVTVYILEFGFPGTEDFQINLERLHQGSGVELKFIQSEKNFNEFKGDEIIIDALFGSGLNRPLEGLTAKLVEHINNSGCKIISIDIPSGLPVDHSAEGTAIVKADHVLSFEVYKMAFLLPENAAYIGHVHILDIGLHHDFYKTIEAAYELIDTELIRSIYKPRNRFSHKGNYGHAALIAGSTGFMGAAVLCAGACIRSGSGKLTCYIPKTGYDIMQIAVPEAITKIMGSGDNIEGFHPIAEHEVIGIGPGMGTQDSNERIIDDLFMKIKKPVVIDADALTVISKHKHLYSKFPAQAIVTPHPKEFERLFGAKENDYEKILLAQQKAKQHNIIIVLKGHHTFIAMPDGKGFFNSTGNAGMAKGGSGDVLTGMLTALVAQKYSPADAALIGVYLHGLAGDIAAKKYSEEAMTARDIIECIGSAFNQLRS